jgi:hypothetical protein
MILEKPLKNNQGSNEGKYEVKVWEQRWVKCIYVYAIEFGYVISQHSQTFNEISFPQFAIIYHLIL